MTTTPNTELYDAAIVGVRALLRYIGDNPDRDGLVDTPNRVVKAFTEMCDGMGIDPATVLTTSFGLHHDQMVVVRDIAFNSMCEHHLLAFSGVAHVAYVPANGKIIGLSKFARCVDVLAHRPQVQERLTDEIAEAIDAAVDNLGVGVRLVASHGCATCRGVRRPDMKMVTTSLRGMFYEDPRTRMEFFTAIG